MALTRSEIQANHRRRQRDGLRVYAVEVHHARTTAELVRAGLLAEEDIDNPDAVSEALSRALDLLTSVTGYSHL